MEYPKDAESLESIEGWAAVAYTWSVMDAQLATGFLESQGIEAMVYPLQEATGFEHLPFPGISEALQGDSTSGHADAQMRVLVHPEDAGVALAALKELRDNPEPPEAS